MTNNGEAPVVLGESEVMDEVRNSKGVLWRPRNHASLPGMPRRSRWRSSGGGELRVVISGVGSVRNSTRRGYQKVRWIKVKEGRPERRWGVPLARRIRRISVAVTVDSGEEFRQPGGNSEGKGRGRRRRGSRAIYRHSGRLNWAGIDAYWSGGGSYCERKRSPAWSPVWGWRQPHADEWGPMSVRGRGIRGYRFGVASWAAGWFLRWAKKLPRGLFLFSLFLFLFLFFFCFLIPLVQIDLIQFVKFPRIQHSNLEM
jgi:hypothetical protein